DEPAVERAELLRTRADPAVDRGGASARELARQAADRRGVDAAGRGDRFRRERAHRALEVFESAHVLGEGAEVDESVGEEGVSDRGEEEPVATGADEEVLVRLLRGARPARVDHDDLAAARADRAQP